MSRVIFILLVALSIGAQASSEELPNGWRFPTQAEIDIVPMRRWSETKFLIASADFNSDGEIDTARIIKDEDNIGEGFAVYLSGLDGFEWKIVKFYEYRSQQTAPMLRMGLSIVEPGNYKTACGKGYWDCKDGEPEELALETNGLSHFLFESASSIWFWDKKSLKFVQVWISD
ncbi:MAG: hypothetical protein GY770_30300 [Aestuariibacter sp.]|nr:hypothetical protein [Aestuariibacter sp.]